MLVRDSALRRGICPSRRPLPVDGRGMIPSRRAPRQRPRVITTMPPRPSPCSSLSSGRWSTPSEDWELETPRPTPLAFDP